MRAREVAPGPVDLEIEVWMNGAIIGAFVQGEDPTPAPDGEGASVVGDLRVAVQVELCCFVCGDALITASLRDSAGREFRGEVGVVPARGVCPDLGACCASADVCPEGLPAQICGS